MIFRHELQAARAGLPARGPLRSLCCFDGGGGGSSSSGNVATTTTSEQVGASDQGIALSGSSGNVIKRGTDITGSTINVEDISPQLATALAGGFAQILDKTLSQQTEAATSLRSNEQELVAQVLSAQKALTAQAAPGASNKEMMYIGLALAAAIAIFAFRK